MEERKGASREQSGRQRCRQDIAGINAPVHLQTAVPMQIILHCHLDLSLLRGLRCIRGGMLLRRTAGSIWDLLCIEILATSLQMRQASKYIGRSVGTSENIAEAAKRDSSMTGQARPGSEVGQQANTSLTPEAPMWAERKASSSDGRRSHSAWTCNKPWLPLSTMALTVVKQQPDGDQRSRRKGLHCMHTCTIDSEACLTSALMVPFTISRQSRPASFHLHAPHRVN